jgi:hypothetical protein
LRTGALLAICLTVGAAGTVLADWAWQCQWRERMGFCARTEGVRIEPREYALAMAQAPGGMKNAWTEPAPAVGAPAPPFSLPGVKADEPIGLQALLAQQKPIVLVFGSLSCNVLHQHLDGLERLYRAHRGHATFLFVNIREAGHPMPGLEFLLPAKGVMFGPQLPWPERRQAVRKAVARVGLTLPVVLDREDNKVMHAYGAFPLRLVVVGADGRIAMDLGRGVFQHWDLKQVDRWLQSHVRQV